MTDVFARTAMGRADHGDPVERHAVLAEIRNGCLVYETLDDQAVARGGVVIGVELVPDPEAGETRRRFATVDWRRGQLDEHLIPEDRVDLSRVVPLDVKSVRDLIRTLADQVAKGKGQLRPDHRRYLQLMGELAGALG